MTEPRQCEHVYEGRRCVKMLPPSRWHFCALGDHRFPPAAEPTPDPYAHAGIGDQLQVCGALTVLFTDTALVCTREPHPVGWAHVAADTSGHVVAVWRSIR